jgi:hypothetical protein
MLRRLFLAILFTLGAVPGRASWLSDATTINVDLNRQFGTGISAMAQPSIDAAENAGHRLIDDADRRASARLTQADAILSRQLADFDGRMEQRIGQVDRITAKRLAEVDTILGKNISRVDDVAAHRITQIDGMLKDRTADVDTLLKADIRDVDERIGIRINQMDEITERRLGNLDTIAMKSTATFSHAIIRLVAFACLMIFMAAAMWRVYVESSGAWPKNGSFSARLNQWWTKVYKPLTLQLGFAAACVIALFISFAITLPGGSSSPLEKTHIREFDRSLSSLDLTEAKYHASQLKILDPTNPQYRGYALKVDLLRDVLFRPSMYQTVSGVRQIVFRIEQAESQLGPSPDADIQTLKALIVFRTNPTRETQHDAAMLCGSALNAKPRANLASVIARAGVAKSDAAPGFALKALALAYVKNYLAQPLPSEAIERRRDSDAPAELSTSTLHDIVRRYESPEMSTSHTLTPLSHVLTYDELVRELSRTAFAQYVQMVKAEARLSTAAAEDRAALLADRTAAAEGVIASWKHFDELLAEHRSIDDTPAAYAVFALNDAVLTRARAYASSQSIEIPARLTQNAYPDAETRVHMLPPRVIWAQRYLTGLGNTVNQVVTYQEAERFREAEARAYDFERDYVDYYANTVHHNEVGNQRLAESAVRASLSAARLSLPGSSGDLAEQITSEMRAHLTPAAVHELRVDESSKEISLEIRRAAVAYL